MDRLGSLTKKVLARITPTKAERAAEQRLYQKIRRFITKQRGPHKGVILAGSIARDTHLAGDKDLDIFVYYSPTLKRESFEQHGLKLAHKVFGDNPHEEAYSEHPYVRGVIDGFEVEIVPVYKVTQATKKISAVDRTPFHANFVKRNLSPKQKGQVRLLKQFFKGVQVYGADTRFQGVPGYLVELLILEYKTFEKSLEAMAEWKEGHVVDVKKQYVPLEARTLFPNASLIAIDPTDKTRNVAAALSANQFARMIAAARAFLQRPTQKFFFGDTEKPLTLNEMRKFLKKEELLGLYFPYPKKNVEDMVWGQLARLSKRAASALEKHDFIVRRTFVHTDGKTHCFLLFDVANPVLQKSKTRMGPKVSEAAHAEAFLKAHPKPLSGPRIEEGRIVLEVERMHTQASRALEAEWKSLAQLEKNSLEGVVTHFHLLSESQILKIVQRNPDFAQALSAFLKGKEFFLG